MIKKLLPLLVFIILTPVAFGQATPTVPQLQSQLQGLLQQLQQLQSQLPAGGAQAISNVVIPRITRNLCLGSSDTGTSGEVSAWQAFIVAQDKGQAARALKAAFDSGVKYGFFGQLTGNATVEWQAFRGVSPTYPCVGAKTRAALNANLGQSQEQLRVVTPNGGETLEIGQTYTIRWTGPAVLQTGYRLILELVTSQGQMPGFIVWSFDSNTYGSKQYNWQVSNVCGGDVCYPAQPGSYRLRATIYDDGYYCTALCPPPTPGQRLAQIVAQDESDATFQIVAAGSVTVPIISSISPTSGPVGTQVTITGSGFIPTNTFVHFTSNSPNFCGKSTSVNSSGAGTNIVYTIPSETDPCTPGLPLLPGGVPQLVTPGVYQIRVGSSNSVNFTVTAPPPPATPTY